MAAVGIVGSGYVGLTTGACFAHLGHDVVCGDVDEEKVARLSRAQVDIVERGLPELVAAGLESGRLRFVSGAAAAAHGAEVVFLCLPTPQAEDGSVDMRFMLTAAEQIASALEHEAVVVTKSTVPVGSTVTIARVLTRPDVHVVSNPEFLREGTAVGDFLHPDRVIIGSDDQGAALKVADLYSSLGSRLILTDPTSAETIKYVANAFLATKLSFVNSVATLCEHLGADIDDVILALGADRRIGPGFLHPGPGWGGSCFPKDTRALTRMAADAGFSFELLVGAIAANEQQIQRITSRILQAAGEAGPVTIGVWGLTFKAGTNDLRDSPALTIVARLLDAGARVQAFDPTVHGGGPQIPSGVHLCTDATAAAQRAHVLAVLTEWEEFRFVDPTGVGAVMTTRHVVDARNVLDRAQWAHAGFVYQGVGRA